MIQAQDNFQEKQRLSQTWVIYIHLAILGLFLIGIIQQVILGKPFGDKPMTDCGLMIGFSIALLIIFWIRSIKLITSFTQERIEIKYMLIHKTIKWSEVKNIELIEEGMISKSFEISGTFKRRNYNLLTRKGIIIHL